MVDISGQLIKSAYALNEAATALCDEVDETQKLQKKYERIADKLTNILRKDVHNLSLSDRSDLASCSGRHNLLRRRMAVQRSSLHSALRAFQSQSNAFTELEERYRDRILKLGQSDAKQDRLRDSLTRTIEMIIGAMWRNPDHQGLALELRVPDTSFGYIPLPLYRFYGLLHDLDDMLMLDPEYALPSGRYRPVRFLEVGCGQGRGLYVLKHSKILLLESIEGFDINAELLDAGREHLALKDELYEADALDVDYGAYDVIYSYRPISDRELLAQLERRMATTMRPGAYLLAPYSFDLGRYPDLQRMDQLGEIWRKSTEPGPGTEGV